MIRLSKSCLSKKETLNVKFSKRNFRMGEEVKKFEDELKFFFNRKALCAKSDCCTSLSFTGMFNKKRR